IMGQAGDDIITSGPSGSITTVLALGAGSNPQLTSNGGKFILDFTGFTSNVTFWLKDGKLLAGWGAQTTGVAVQAISNTAQQIDVDLTAGAFTLSFGGQTTGALDVGITAADLQNALNGLSSIGPNGGVSVSKLPGNHYL